MDNLTSWEQKGFEKGFEQGFKEGYEKGVKLARQEIARAMIQENFPIEQISRLTELTIVGLTH
jgi:predicted transposase/invertase (TIGR01784 family)